VLVEAYLDGPEVRVECVTYPCETTVVAVTRKTVSVPPYFWEWPTRSTPPILGSTWSPRGHGPRRAASAGGHG
jgi:hypothetical protein